MSHTSSGRKNPSRQTCETAIKRILMTEVLENGTNKHFKTAADFMSYFESLYIASDALTKQVQRAVKALNMPKDEKGYFIVNKTVSQLDQENTISSALSLADAKVVPMDNCETVFLSIAPNLKSYVLDLISKSETFEGKYITIVETFNGLLFYTNSTNQLNILLNSLII